MCKVKIICLKYFSTSHESSLRRLARTPVTECRFPAGVKGCVYLNQSASDWEAATKITKITDKVNMTFPANYTMKLSWFTPKINNCMFFKITPCACKTSTKVQSTWSTSELWKQLCQTNTKQSAGSKSLRSVSLLYDYMSTHFHSPDLVAGLAYLHRMMSCWCRATNFNKSPDQSEPTGPLWKRFMKLRYEKLANSCPYFSCTFQLYFYVFKEAFLWHNIV